MFLPSLINRKERGAARQGGENLGFPGGGRVRPSAKRYGGRGASRRPRTGGYQYVPLGGHDKGERLREGEALAAKRGTPVAGRRVIHGFSFSNYR